MSLRLSLAKHPSLGEGCPTSVSVEGTRYVIGRDDQADWTLADTAKAISALHCEILFDGATYTLRDLSTNGTYLNGATERLDGPHVLRDGDTIAVGLYLIRATLSAEAALSTSPRSEKPADDIWMQAVPRNATAPRGGDPAAMMAPDGGAWPVVEEVRGGSDGIAAFADMTMIFPAPKRQPKAPAPVEPAPAAQAVVPPASSPLPAPALVAPVPEPAPPAQAPAPVRAAPVAPDLWAHPAPGPAAGDETDGKLVRRLAAGLGVAPGSLGAADAAELVARLASVTRRLVVGVKDLLDERTRTQRALGSRQFAIPRGQARNPIKFSARPEDALLLLMSSAGTEADAAMDQSFAELKQHQQALLVAAQTAARMLGDDLAPSAFTQNTSATIEQKARLWDLYGALWQGLETDWASGFVEAFKLHMASTYDQESG